MNQEELHALLRFADAHALRAAEDAIDIENALVSAKEAELHALLTYADSQALQAAEDAIDVDSELVAAKAAAASQLITEQAIGEAPPALVLRSLMHIVDVSGTVTVTTSAARRRSRAKIILAVGAVWVLAAAGASAFALHRVPHVHINAESSITTATSALTGMVVGLGAMGFIRSRKLERTVERSAWRMAGQMAKVDNHKARRSYARTRRRAVGHSERSDQTIVAMALPEWNVQRPGRDADKGNPRRDHPMGSLESTAEC